MAVTSLLFAFYSITAQAQPAQAQTDAQDALKQTSRIESIPTDSIRPEIKRPSHRVWGADAQDGSHDGSRDGGRSFYPKTGDSPQEDQAWLNLRPYPFAVWGPRVGFGGGVGLVLNDMVQPGDETLATVAPSRFEQAYTLSYTTAAGPDLINADGWLMAGGRHAYTTRDWFYGFGPASSANSRVAFSLRTFQGHLRAGRSLVPDGLFGGKLILQAHARIEHYRLYDAELPTFSPTLGDGTTPTPTARTVRYARSIAGLDTDAVPSGARFTTTGTVLGGDLSYDRRDRAHLTTRGLLLQASAERWLPTSGAEFAFWRTDIDAYGWIPITGRHRIALRFRLSQIHETKGARPLTGSSLPQDDLPHFILPRLDGRDLPGLTRSRYHGRDVLAASAAYEFPIRTILGFRIEGHVGAYAGSAYDDIGKQFELAFDASETLARDRDTYPLRPTVGAGLRVGPQFRDDSYVDVAVGRGPEGYSAVRVSLVRRLGRPRPPHHTTNHWRR